jgi:hypothetical protein
LTAKSGNFIYLRRFAAMAAKSQRKPHTPSASFKFQQIEAVGCKLR